jgi:hypothetical protein
LFLTLSSDATSALPFLTQPLTFVFHVLPTLDVPYALITSSPPLQPLFRCHVGITCTSSAIRYTWKPRTSVQSARRVP